LKQNINSLVEQKYDDLKAR